MARLFGMERKCKQSLAKLQEYNLAHNPLGCHPNRPSNSRSSRNGVISSVVGGPHIISTLCLNEKINASA